MAAAASKAPGPSIRSVATAPRPGGVSWITRNDWSAIIASSRRREGEGVFSFPRCVETQYRSRETYRTYMPRVPTGDRGNERIVRLFAGSAKRGTTHVAGTLRVPDSATILRMVPGVCGLHGPWPFVPGTDTLMAGGVPLMAFLIGADEAGYGPNLGPLVISASVWQVPDGVEKDGLYGPLAAAVSRVPQPAGGKAVPRVAIADSKLLYHSGHGLALLERGLWAAWAVEKRSEATEPAKIPSRFLMTRPKRPTYSRLITLF